MHARFAKSPHVFWRKSASVLGVAIVLLSLSQLVLLWKVLTAEKTWILVPHLSKVAALSNKRVSKEYITSWADNLTRTLLCINPDFINIYKIKVITVHEAQRNPVLLRSFERDARKGFRSFPLPDPASSGGCDICSQKEACSCLATSESAPLYAQKHTSPSERTTHYAT